MGSGRRTCVSCQGSGKLQTWDSKKKQWVWATCHACNGKGYIVLPNV